MILGIDTGLATFGWALLDEDRCRFLEVGVVTTKKSRGKEGKNVSLDRARRSLAQIDVLVAKGTGVRAIVVEQMSFPPGAGMNAAVPIALSYGAVLGISRAVAPTAELLTVSPATWRREVVPGASDGEDGYQRVYEVGSYLLQRHPAKASLDRIKDSLRSHAVDAAMIALAGHLRRSRCQTIRGVSSRMP